MILSFNFSLTVGCYSCAICLPMTVTSFIYNRGVLYAPANFVCYESLFAKIAPLKDCWVVGLNRFLEIVKNGLIDLGD